MESGEVPGAVNIHWGYKNVAGELTEALNLPVRVGNDANVAALGEMWAGGGRGASNLIMVTLGTGVGGGVIVNGKIVTGAHGAGGEIGHAIMEPRKRKPATAVTGDAWSSMRRRQALCVWRKDIWRQSIRTAEQYRLQHGSVRKN